MRNLLLVLILVFPTTALAQIIGPLTSEFNSIRQNGVSSIAATGDTVWISPALDRNIGNGPEWFRPSGIDFIDEGEARVFQLKQLMILSLLALDSLRKL